MEPSATEAQLKKKLAGFLAEMMRLGTVKGFKYFAMYLRGREEMILSVVNQPQIGSRSISAHKDRSEDQHRKMSISESFSSNNLPYDQRSLMLSMRSQMILSTHGVKDIGLPPASPSEEESLPKDEKSTLFMIAGYGRYSCPYAWVRSNHERLVKLTGDSDREKDCPLKLKSTLRWQDSDVYVWDLIAELVKLCTYPAPRNPFEIDFDYFSMLPLGDRVLATAAMVNMLQKILIHTQDQKVYAGPMFEELQLITKQHFLALEKLAQEQGLPALQKTHQQHELSSSSSSSQRARPMGRVRTSSYTQQQQPAGMGTTTAAGGGYQQGSQYGYSSTSSAMY